MQFHLTRRTDDARAARVALGLSLMSMSDDQRTIVERSLLWLQSNEPEYRLTLQCIREEEER
jgi:hypothetical protein